MLIRYGCELSVVVNQPTPSFCLVDVHHERRPDIVEECPLTSWPHVPFTDERDTFGNRLRRFTAPAGEIGLRLSGIIADSGVPEVRDMTASAVPVPHLPVDALRYLSGSRYCETDKLASVAWSTFGHLPRNGALVQAICDFTNAHITFDYNEPAARAQRWKLTRSVLGLPRFRTSRHYAVPLPEYSGALRQRLPRRHRRALRSGTHGFQCMDRGLS